MVVEGGVGGFTGDAQTKQMCHSGGALSGFVQEACLALLTTLFFRAVCANRRSRCVLTGVRSCPAVSLWTERKGIRALAA